MSWAQHCERGQVTCPHCRQRISLRLLPGRGGAEVPRLTMMTSSSNSDAAPNDAAANSEAAPTIEVPAGVAGGTIVPSRPRGRPPHDPLTGIPMIWDTASGAYVREQEGGADEEAEEEEEAEAEVEVVADLTEAVQGQTVSGVEVVVTVGEPYAELAEEEEPAREPTEDSDEKASEPEMDTAAQAEAGSSQDPLPEATPLPGTMIVRPAGREFRSWTLTSDPKVCKACNFLWPANTVTINVREQSIKNCTKYGAMREKCRCEQKFARLMAKTAVREASETVTTAPPPPPEHHASRRCSYKRSLEPRSEEEAERMLKRALKESMKEAQVDEA